VRTLKRTVFLPVVFSLITMPTPYDRVEPLLSGRRLLRAGRQTNRRSETPARSETAAYQSSRTAQGRGDKNRPTALSLLDKYAQTQDKLQSFIIKGETHYPNPSFSIKCRLAICYAAKRT